MTHKQAKQAGANAFNSGKSSIPAQNREFLKSACESQNDSVGLFKSFRHGWTIAMLAQGQGADFPSVQTLKTFTS